MKSAEEIMEILESFDLTGSYREAARLAGIDHHTVARYVAQREAGGETPGCERRARLIDPHLPKLEEWVERSKGRIRADVCHDKLRALGYQGSERTTRRAVAEAKAAWRAGRRRVHRPWVPEPGMWFQWDWATGPRVEGRETQLFCAWLAWSRYRVVIPAWDKALPTLVASIDQALRRFGGAPTYALTDNEKTVTTCHVARLAVRNPEMAAGGRHYRMRVATCLPADAPTKGGSEATVRVAKADLVPTDANLLPDYRSFAELRAACDSFCSEVNHRPHRVTRRPPGEMLAEERAYLHPLPADPYTLAFGETRRVGERQPTIQVDYCLYSVPHQLLGEVVWVRSQGEEVVVTHLGPKGATEVARHPVTTPGNPRIDPAHFPPQPEGPLHRTPVAQNPAEAEFLSIGEGARRWLVEAAQAGTRRVRAKMAEAVALARLHGREPVDWALGHCGVMGRFREGDLATVLRHQASATPGQALSASEAHSLASGTSSWANYGQIGPRAGADGSSPLKPASQSPAEARLASDRGETPGHRAGETP